MSDRAAASAGALPFTDFNTSPTESPAFAAGESFKMLTIWHWLGILEDPITGLKRLISRAVPAQPTNASAAIRLIGERDTGRILDYFLGSV